MTDEKLTPERVRELLDGTTPGPWVLQGAQGDQQILHVTGHQSGWAIGDHVMCWESGWLDNTGPSLVNAQLIAAAPELATALLTAWKELDEAQRRLAEYIASQIAYASEFPCVLVDGWEEPDVDNIHANIRALKAEHNKLTINATAREGLMQRQLDALRASERLQDTLRTKIKELHELLAEARDIISEVAPGYSVWLDEADKAL